MKLFPIPTNWTRRWRNNTKRLCQLYFLWWILLNIRWEEVSFIEIYNEDLIDLLYRGEFVPLAYWFEIVRVVTISVEGEKLGVIFILVSVSIFVLKSRRTIVVCGRDVECYVVRRWRWIETTSIIREDSKGNILWSGLQEIKVNSVEDVIA